MELFIIGLLATVGMFFGILGAVLSIICMIRTIAAEKSTHKIVYHDPFGNDKAEFPMSPNAVPDPEQDLEDPWSFSEDEVEEINKKAKENKDIY
jgi:actin-related protein